VLAVLCAENNVLAPITLDSLELRIESTSALKVNLYCDMASSRGEPLQGGWVAHPPSGWKGLGGEGIWVPGER